MNRMTYDYITKVDASNPPPPLPPTNVSVPVLPSPGMIEDLASAGEEMVNTLSAVPLTPMQVT